MIPVYFFLRRTHQEKQTELQDAISLHPAMGYFLILRELST